MPDTRSHRGPHPEDDRLFGSAVRPRLVEAVADLCWLLSRGYATPSALKLVGDRHVLAARQRVAVARLRCSDADAGTAVGPIRSTAGKSAADESGWTDTTC